MEASEIRKRFRLIDLTNYPKLQGLDRKDIYSGKMGPGGLFFASQMADSVSLSQGTRVMDLGCGRAGTSVFLAKTYGAQVCALDLWISREEMQQTIDDAACGDLVAPYNVDATKDLSFEDGYFDVIFCMDAFHYFGANEGFLAHISRYLKSGGQFVVGNPCFDREFERPIPPVYEAFWDSEFSKYHSPRWWEDLFVSTDMFENIAVHEARDGVILWEDALLFDLETGNTKGGRLEADADEIVFGHDHPEYPYLTHYILTCTKK